MRRRRDSPGGGDRATLGGLVLIALTLSAALVPSNVAGAPQTRPVPADSADVSRLIESLSDPDASVRRRASDQLVAIGPRARRQVLRAIRSDDPERRALAAEILRKLPWHSVEDPPAVRTLMQRYGAGNDSARSRLIGELSDLPDGTPALLRLLEEEPNERLRWEVVRSFAATRDERRLELIRQMDVSPDDPAALVLAGRAWIERDRPRALDLLRRAITADERQPTQDGGTLSYAYEMLTEEAFKRTDFDDAAALQRRQLGRRQPTTTLTSLYFARLMALHARFGPLRGFDADLTRWGAGIGASGIDPTDWLADQLQQLQQPPPPAPAQPLQPAPPAVDSGPRARVALFRFLSLLGAAPPLPCEPVELTNWQHYHAGNFLKRYKLLGAAEIELKAALKEEKNTRLRYEVLFALADLASQRNEDVATADYLEKAVTLRQQVAPEPGGRAAGDEDVWADIHFRRARAAQARGDAQAADSSVRELLKFTPGNTDSTLEIIDWMNQTARDPAAKTLFEKVYAQTRARVDAASGEELPVLQNDLAWLCARAGRRLDEALELARSAVAGNPENAAYLDTLAEVHFRRGNAAEAIQLEEKAIALSPENEFMKTQLTRFRAGPPATQPR